MTSDNELGYTHTHTEGMRTTASAKAPVTQTTTKKNRRKSNNRRVKITNTHLAEVDLTKGQARQRRAFDLTMLADWASLDRLRPTIEVKPLRLQPRDSDRVFSIRLSRLGCTWPA